MLLALEPLLDYEPLVRIHLGPLSISPHGLGIAVGFLLAASVFLRWNRRAGISDDVTYSFVNRAAVGSIIGARLAYALNHPADFANPLEIFAVWKGGISLLGGIAGAILAGVPKMRKEGLSFWKVMDLAVPCVTMGIIVGRIGDLVIADHLGKPTDFLLGYVCPAAETGSLCDSNGDGLAGPVGQAVHQPALYDLFSATLLLLVLLRLRRTRRYDGFLTVFFGAWYGAGRFIEDFFRIDVTHGTGLTGSQWTAVVVMTLCLWVLLVRRDTPWRSGRGEMASIPRAGGDTATEPAAEPAAEPATEPATPGEGDPEGGPVESVAADEGDDAG